MNQNEENRDACAAQSEGAIPSTSRQLRTITLVEQQGDHGLIHWVLIEGSSTVFNLDEPNLLHAVSQQVFGIQTHRARPVSAISREAFNTGLGTGRHIGAQEERSRAARARVQVEEAAEAQAAAEAKRAGRRRPGNIEAAAKGRIAAIKKQAFEAGAKSRKPAAAKKTTAKRRTR